MAYYLMPINTTKDYHINALTSLGWELTVCNALHPEDTPLRKVLVRDDSYGHLLYDYLRVLLPMERVRRVIEIGGGYGYLMKDFLGRDTSLKPVMLDISPYLLGKQKETLGGQEVVFRQGDFLETDPGDLASFDLAILNENMGDFPTLVGIDRRSIDVDSEPRDPGIMKARHFFTKYGLEAPEGDTFNMNIGALDAIEKLCESGVPYIYLGEHSCEAKVPEALRSIVQIEATGNPERISLMGHDEYTIKFSHLERLAHASGYHVVRGPFADFVRVEWTDRLRYIMRSQGRGSDEGEMICQFIEDLYKYEYLLLTK